ncbi:hypothetical protein COO60DRAFT_523977 [Scenedesmus sp. NREL 46B-D3]|nr:hypothetical protein COO60DRAFT_523977 [Scenedesmus sp. NREL 46B-D3]
MALLARSTVARPVARAPVASRVVSVRRVVVRSNPPAAVETAIKEAEDKCASGTTGECAAAWDNVEEISAHISHKKVTDASSDPWSSSAMTTQMLMSAACTMTRPARQLWANFWPVQTLSTLGTWLQLHPACSSQPAAIATVWVWRSTVIVLSGRWPLHPCFVER